MQICRRVQHADTEQRYAKKCVAQQSPLVASPRSIDFGWPLFHKNVDRL